MDCSIFVKRTKYHNYTWNCIIRNATESMDFKLKICMKGNNMLRNGKIEI